MNKTKENKDSVKQQQNKTNKKHRDKETHNPIQKWVRESKQRVHIRRNRNDQEIPKTVYHL